jgi:predicted nucleic acid-binding protein
MRHGEAVFCDSGAWIALALKRDPLHEAAAQQWELLQRYGAKLHTSIPVVIETFTFLDRNANRDVAMLWRDSISRPSMIKILPCELRDLEQSWEYFRRTDFAQAVGGRCDKLRGDETSAHPHRLHLRSSLRRRGLPAGRLNESHGFSTAAC